jgi:NAD(P)-dependent dehydrogenase (short-subunit alcohol dehydrogenase family)
VQLVATCPLCQRGYADQIRCLRLLQERMQVEATNLKRLGTPQDIAGAVAFLSSPDASYVTGETLVVAGGMQSRL